MLNVAIDGPGGAGKSSVAKAMSLTKGLRYLDTGALYRAVGLVLTEQGIDVTDETEVAPALSSLEVQVDYDAQGKQLVYVNGRDVTDRIRTPEAGAGASKVAVHACVRDKLMDIQRQTAKIFDVIMDGRDIGTVVLPNADLKIYITATAEERGRRRFLELEKAGAPHGTLEETIQEIAERDYRDSHRAVAPLKQADDAILLDTTNLTKEETIALVGRMVDEARERSKNKQSE